MRDSDKINKEKTVEKLISFYYREARAGNEMLKIKINKKSEPSCRSSGNE